MIGSPLYRISAEHLAAAVALFALPIGLWLLRRGRTATLPPIERLLVWLLAGSALIHIGLVVVNDHGFAIAALFLGDAIALGLVARRVVRGSRPGRLGMLLLSGSIVAYWVSNLSGQAPDQLGLATKLAEILALAIVLRPDPGARRRMLRSLAGGLAICLLVIGTAAGSWLGAFRASAAEPGAVSALTAHSGSVPPPGTIIPAAPAREATPVERAAANDLLSAARTALARYADPAQAAADGYRVDGLAGVDFHASNDTYGRDGRIFDPARPESLVYAVAPNGRRVLLGAVFQLPEVGQPSPTLGGPLAVWHAHEDICISLLPPALSAVLSPLGGCPVGSILLPRTPAMLHLWTVPGAPEPFGDLSQEWRRAYLEQVAAHGP